MGMVSKEKYNVIIPIASGDFETVRCFLPRLSEYLPAKKIILIGNKEVREKIENVSNSMIGFLAESELIEIDSVRDIIAERTKENEKAVKRAGWYLQQFLKMKYSLICEDEYYLVWDSDTLPLDKLEIFEEGCPVFHLKTEYWPAYFRTISTILPEFEKSIGESFIAEHMLINCKIMRELLTEIESNEKILGNTFYEKILNGIEICDIAGSGFSEFETYGTYCLKKYPGTYLLRNWKSLREGTLYFDYQKFGNSERKWLTGEYDAISFEKNAISLHGYKIFHLRLVHVMFRFKTIKWFVDKINNLIIDIRGK